MAGVNKVILVGRLGSDPELKMLSNGQAVAKLSIATSEKWTDKQGNKQERTEWHRCTLWGKLAENTAKYTQKGSMIYVEGKLQTRSWDDKETGQKRFATEVVGGAVQFIGDRRDSQNAVAQSNNDAAGGDFQPPTGFDSNEEIPF